MTAAIHAAPANVKRYQLSRIFMILGLGTIVVSILLATRKVEPFYTWFFNFAWWGFILFIDGWVYRHRQESLILSFPGRFLFLCGWSVVFWGVFEAFNIRLQNWVYWDLPDLTGLRWLGYCLAFATVVPGILETADLIDTAGVVKTGRIKPLGWKKRVGPYMMAAGFAMLALPLLWPRWFFPLVWGGLVFLLDPINERLGNPSFVSDWREGRLRRLYILLLAGLFCGGLWEWWNAMAHAHWTYSIPVVGRPRIFEMPALGFLGFAPFAAEAYAATSLATCFWEKSSKPVRGLMIAAAVFFCIAMCWTMDRFTVRSFQS